MIADADYNVSKLYGMLPAPVSGDPTKRTPADNQTVRNVFVIGPDKKVKLILIYPMTDQSREYPSYQRNASGYMLTTAALHWFMDNYIPDPLDRKDYWSPMPPRRRFRGSFRPTLCPKSLPTQPPASGGAIQRSLLQNSVSAVNLCDLRRAGCLGLRSAPA